VSVTPSAQAMWDDHTIRNRYRVHRARGQHLPILEITGLTEVQADQLLLHGPDNPWVRLSDEMIARLKPHVPPWK
jgi:hypothetical protein